ncbi:unnamed protein product [Cylicostephanus goldi]|uniref:Uncharacterized protein n=1 Tax=Cylicostephanus goldi TaxID=71465 RepID=A0A3P6SAC8_CYLGO|nr:unnamed protein product [Cylicostephanus goldi]
MPDIKNLLTPKVAIPAFAAVVLLVAATLVAIFYIRNPSVTDNLFNHDDETTPIPEEEHRQKGAAAAGGSYHSQNTPKITTMKVLTMTTVASTPAPTSADGLTTTGTGEDPNQVDNPRFRSNVAGFFQR